MKALIQLVRKNLTLSISLFINLFIFSSCNKPKEQSNPIVAANRYLYVASGSCYSGSGIATFNNTTSSNFVYRINLANSQKDIEFADYNSSPAQFGDTPVGLANKDSNSFYALVENTSTGGARRIEIIAKNFSSRTLFSNNTTALNAQLRSITALASGDLLISKSSAIEKITSANARITVGANPFVVAPASTCATSTTLITKAQSLSNGFIVFSHAATGQNRIGFIKPLGYASATDCALALAAPNANSFPTALAYDSENKILFVAYAGNTTTTDINSIYAYTLSESETSVSISATNKIYDSSLYGTTHLFLLFGISDMTFDPVDKKLYVASAITTATTAVNYSIEKLNFDSAKLGSENGLVLTRIENSPFKTYGGDTKCISSLMIAD